VPLDDEVPPLQARKLLTPAALAAGTFFFFTGAAGADEIVGDETGEFLEGTDGADTISGNGGDDHLHGGAGNDTVSGGEGDDDVSGGTGDDIVDGGPGEDFVVGDEDIRNEGPLCVSGDVQDAAADPDDCPGDDTITGGDDDDAIVGDGGICLIGGGDEEELLEVTAADVQEDCAGDDTIDGGDGDDVILGDGTYVPECSSDGPIFDPFTGFEDCLPGGDDTITGGDGDDAVEGGNGDDTIDGGDGDDVLVGDNLSLLFFGFLTDEELAALDYDTLMLLGEQLRELLDTDELTEEDREALEEELLFISLLLAGGDDEITGGPGRDVLLGLAGDDVLCADGDDSLVLGGTGTDIPCPTDGTQTVEAGKQISGTVAPVRGLDDEDLEVDEEGNPNPFFYVVVVAPTKGTLVLDATTGAYTYTAFEESSGTDTFQIGIRRSIPECQDLGDFFEVGAASLDEICLDEDLLRAQAIITIDGEDFIEKVAIVTVTITPKPVLVADPPPAAPRVAAGELARTGVDTDALAIGAMALIAAGLLAQAEADRRRRRLAYAAR
jgi:Ca2+-binding RTX toxin-like protein